MTSSSWKAVLSCKRDPLQVETELNIWTNLKYGILQKCILVLCRMIWTVLEKRLKEENTVSVNEWGEVGI